MNTKPRRLASLSGVFRVCAAGSAQVHYCGGLSIDKADHCERYPVGLGATFKIVEDLIRSDADALGMWTETTKQKPGGANNPWGGAGKPDGAINLDNIQGDRRTAPTGTSLEAGLRKLQKAAREGNEKAAAQLAEVKAGRKKVHSACVAAGVRKPSTPPAEERSRADLTPAQVAWNTQRRKDLYEALHPETAHGGDRGASRQFGDSKTDRFTSDTAERTGRSERAIQRDAERS